MLIKYFDLPQKQHSPSTAIEEKRSAGPSYPFQFKGNMLPPHPTTTRAPIFYKRNTPQAMTEAMSLPLGVPVFKPLKTPSNIQSMVRKPNDIASHKGALHQYPAPNLSGHNTSKPSLSRPSAIGHMQQASAAFKVPAFQTLPSSVSRVSSGHIVQVGSADVRKLAASNMVDPNYSTIQRIDVSFLQSF